MILFLLERGYLKGGPILISLGLELVEVGVQNFTGFRDIFVDSSSFM